MTMEDLEIKFNSLSDELLSKERQYEIKNMILNCEEIKANEFMEKLTV